MPRYMVERNFPEGLRIPLNAEGAEICRMIVMINEKGPRDFLIQQNWVNARKGLLRARGAAAVSLSS